MITKETTIEASDVENIINSLHENNAIHIKRGFYINDGNIHVGSNHLIEEAVEFQAALTLGDDRDSQVEEAADTLICLLSTLNFANITLEEVCQKAVIKISENWTTDSSKVTANKSGFTRSGRKQHG